MIYLLALIIMTPILSVVITIIRWKQRQHLNLKKLNSTLRLKNCLVTGSSTGLGRELGREIVRAGGNLILISRGKTMSKNINATGMASETMTKTLATNTAMTELEETRIELEKEKIYEDQVVESYCCDLGDYDQVLKLFETLKSLNKLPQFLICNAGSSTAGFLASQVDNSTHEWMMRQNYYSSLYVLRAVLKVTQISDDGSLKISGISKEQATLLPERIVFVGSVLSLISFIGYSAYSASKYALLGLADALKSELKPLGIKVSIYFPGNMNTPGMEKENVGKPEITKQIEGASALASPSLSAKILLSSLLHDETYISSELIGELIRIAKSPRLDLFEILGMGLLGFIFGIWKWMCEWEVEGYFRNQSQ